MEALSTDELRTQLEQARSMATISHSENEELRKAGKANKKALKALRKEAEELRSSAAPNSAATTTAEAQRRTADLEAKLSSEQRQRDAAVAAVRRLDGEAEVLRETAKKTQVDLEECRVRLGESRTELAKAKVAAKEEDLRGELLGLRQRAKDAEAALEKGETAQAFAQKAQRGRVAEAEAVLYAERDAAARQAAERAEELQEVAAELEALRQRLEEAVRARTAELLAKAEEEAARADDVGAAARAYRRRQEQLLKDLRGELQKAKHELKVEVLKRSKAEELCERLFEEISSRT